MHMFGPVWGAAGVQGFFGKGYRFHRMLGPFGPDFTGVTFVAKTTTFYPKEGNTPLLGAKDDYEPKETFPKSVYVGLKGFMKGYALNSWGLSGPGLEALLETGRWQIRKIPFQISFMPDASRKESGLDQTAAFVDMIKRYDKKAWLSEFGVQLNLSCPNTAADTSNLIKEAQSFLNVMATIKHPIIVKVSVDMPLVAVSEIAEHKACNAISVSNTVKFGKLPEQIRWNELFGQKSPLEKLGGGGLSGSPLLPMTIDYVTRLRSLGVTKHVNAGGGILSPSDAKRLIDAGADSIFIGSMAMLRPWRVQKTVHAIKNLLLLR